MPGKIKTKADVKRNERIQMGIVLVVLLGVVGYGYHLYRQNQEQQERLAQATPWELANKDELLAMKARAEAFARQGQTQAAFNQYDALLEMVQGKSLQDKEIVALYETATKARRELGNVLAGAKSKAPPATRRVVAIASSRPATAPTTSVAAETPTLTKTNPLAQAPTESTPPEPTPTPTPVEPAPVTAVKTPATAPIDIALASTRPAGSQDEGARLRDVLNGLLQQGTNALAAGEYQAALETLLDARQVFEKKMRGKFAPAGGPEHVALSHGLALAYQLLQKPERASPLFENNTPLDKACNAKGVGRQLLITRATLDATQGYLAMRTVVSMTNYLKEHPDELDSELLDLLFTSLQKADERVNNRELMLEPSMKLYADFNARLEATRPGEKRWGVQWVPERQFDDEMRKRKEGIARSDAAYRALEQAVAQVADAEAAVAVAKRPSGGGRGAINAALSRLDAAQGERARLAKVAAEAKAAIPQVPGLTKEDFRKLLTPHDVTVVTSRSAKSTSTAVADGTSRPIAFSLGGDNTLPKGYGVDPTPTTVAPAKPDELRVVAPPARRTFTRQSTGFSVGPDLLLTAAGPVEGSRRIVVEFPNAAPVDAVIERTGDGMALLRLQGKRLAYFNLASGFAGGSITCPAFPDVSIFGIALEMIAGKALAPQEQGWKVSLAKHPRLPGAPLIDESGNLVGMETGERDDRYETLPALSSEKIKAFLGPDLPAQPSPGGKGFVVQITAAFER